jgi:plastocyanin
MIRKHASLLAAGLLLGSMLLAGCSNNNSPNNPGGGGGGGGAKELNSGNIASGGNFPHTFNTAGTFDYHCTIHGLAMSGTVTVAAGGAAGAAISIGDNFYNPSSVTIAPGTTVTWTNNGAITHTVTSN